MWGDKDLEGKRKVRYYKDVINPNLKNKRISLLVLSNEKKINIDKIRRNSHDLHTEHKHWSITRFTPWDKRRRV